MCALRTIFKKSQNILVGSGMQNHLGHTNWGFLNYSSEMKQFNAECMFPMGLQWFSTNNPPFPLFTMAISSVWILSEG